jgi:hypothetical protein
MCLTGRKRLLLTVVFQHDLSLLVHQSPVVNGQTILMKMIKRQQCITNNCLTPATSSAKPSLSPFSAVKISKVPLWRDFCRVGFLQKRSYLIRLMPQPTERVLVTLTSFPFNISSIAVSRCFRLTSLSFGLSSMAPW